MMSMVWVEAEAGSGEAAVDQGGLGLDFPQTVLDDLPGPPPPLRRPFRYPQLSSDLRHRHPPVEPFHGRQPHLLPPPAAPGG